MVSKYLEQFKQLQHKAGDKFALLGGRVLIERLPEVEIKTAGGLILGQAKTHRATAQDYKAEVGVVLLTGSGYIDENGNSVPMDLKPGEVVIIPTGCATYSTFPGLNDYTENSLIMAQESSIWFKYESLEALEACGRVLSGLE